MKPPEKLSKKELFRKLLDISGVYISTIAGVMMTGIVLDMKKGKRQSFILSFRWERLAVAAVIAAIVMFNFERGGDSIGKSGNFYRRISHGFGQGSALRGIVELLSMLFVFMD